MLAKDNEQELQPQQKFDWSSVIDSVGLIHWDWFSGIDPVGLIQWDWSSGINPITQGWSNRQSRCDPLVPLVSSHRPPNNSQLKLAWSIPLLNAFHNVRLQVSYLNEMRPIWIANQHCARADQDLGIDISMPYLSIFLPPPTFKTAMPHTPYIRQHHLSSSELQEIPSLAGVYYTLSIPAIPRRYYPPKYYQREELVLPSRSLSNMLSMESPRWDEALPSSVVSSSLMAQSLFISSSSLPLNWSSISSRFSKDQYEQRVGNR